MFEFNSDIIQRFTDWAIGFVPKLLLSILILIIGFWIANKLHKLLTRTLNKASISKEILNFLLSLADIAFKFVVIMVAASILGFQTSSLIAVLAAAGFAVAMALQGFMGNFASGITIVFFKPYKIGDWVEVSEKFGKVVGIQIFNTILETPNHKTLVIPNGQVTDNIITNYSTVGHIKLELHVSMPYGESFPRVKQIIFETLKDTPKVLHSVEPEVGILNYDSHYITLVVRPAILPDDYWEVTFDVNERIKAAFNANKVQMAYSEGIELGDIGN